MTIWRKYHPSMYPRTVKASSQSIVYNEILGILDLRFDSPISRCIVLTFLTRANPKKEEEKEQEYTKEKLPNQLFHGIPFFFFPCIVHSTIYRVLIDGPIIFEHILQPGWNFTVHTNPRICIVSTHVNIHFVLSQKKKIQFVLKQISLSGSALVVLK